MKHVLVADAFEELADLAELAGGDPTRSRALRSFAHACRTTQRTAGAPPELRDDVDELVRGGTLRELEDLRHAVPSSLLDVVRVPGLGPKRVRALWKTLGVTSLGELAYACKENRLAILPEFGEATQQRTLAAATFLLEGAGRVPLARAMDLGGMIARALVEGGAHAADVAGEARRGVEIVTEIVVVAGGIDVGEAHDALVVHPRVRAVTDLGAHGFRATIGHRLHVRVRAVPREDYVAALLAETGDAAHVRWLADVARQRELDLAQVTRRATTEEGVYRALGLEVVPPELREGAAPSVPPDLVGQSDIGAILHLHTDWSDGTVSLLRMARAAQSAGHSVVGISDHSKTATYARGLDERRLREQRGAVDAARRELPGITILHGVEVDILDDGSLDLDDAALAELDFVIASVHTALGQDAATMTRRLVRAVSHPLVTVLGHPTGRLLLARKPATFDLAEVAAAAAANETYLEINANANRLDLSDALVRRAAAAGAEFVVNPDAHEEAGIADERFGIRVARRAALSSSQILNARPVDAFLAKLAARRLRARSALGL